jgi:hypothetical protein
MKMDAICSSETKVNFHQTLLRYTPEDGALHSRLRENLRSIIFLFVVSILHLSLKHSFIFHSFIIGISR